MFTLKKFLFNTLFNTCLFLFLVVSIQNSSDKKRVNLFVNETVNLPISFIIGTSFLTGSFIGAFLQLNFKK